MTEVTRRELAERIGCTKQTVAKALREIDLDGHVVKRGQTEYYDDYVASAVADRLAPRFRRQEEDGGGGDAVLDLLEHYKSALVESEARRDAEASRHASETERYGRLIDSLQADVARLTAALDEERLKRDELERRLSDTREALSAIAAAPFWRRGAIASRALLPSPPDGNGGRDA